MLSCTKKPTACCLTSEGRSPKMIAKLLPRPAWNAARLPYWNVPVSDVKLSFMTRRNSPPNLIA